MSPLPLPAVCPPLRFVAAALALAAILLAGGQAAAQPSESGAVLQPPAAATDIARLIDEGRLQAALERADAHLGANPRDVQVRFLRGVILVDMKRPAEAMAVFEALTQEFPELPEPYNNLATLYAAQGRHELARVALQRAITAQPGYATAHENLGDLYLAMAAESYQQAARLVPGNPAVQAKLKLARDAAARPQSARSTN